ncbi:LysR family transcriptional regulator [Pseudomonas syringae]|uniref:LysR family transcriptional regulator n=1 Tax=Pseudomonas syringae TaxID=317 RepID=UPI001F102AA0|nr:LysR family transcriptional regulator [Pseudomonas syringae]MCH5487735.1 LysR family transcriptional regulator [Pseudomonas syringae pv. syringae]MDO1458878.1 LysR family transcriptional regulator [Pseudomonas syringae pv. syringae]
MEIHNLNDIAAFVTAVNAGSYTAAAKQLGLTRSAVGKSIVRLEARLQVRLLNRTTRSLSMTDDGQVLYERCVGVLQDLDDVEDALAFRRSTPSGRLRISVPVAVGRLHVLQHIECCLKEWPTLSVDVTFSDRLVDLIDEGFDLAMRIGPPKEDSRLLTRTVAYQKMITCASPEYLGRYSVPRTPQDLHEHQCLHFVSGGRLLPWNFRVNGKPVTVTNGGRLQMNSAESLHQSAIAGLGITTLPSYVVNEELRSGRLIQLLKEYAEAAEPIRIIYPSKRHLSPKIRLFIDKLLEAWSPCPPWERQDPES